MRKYLSSNKLVSNVAWKFGERMCAQIVTLIISVILARKLCPEDYGIIAVVNVFITLANVLVSDGFGNALIQKKDADDEDFSSVFYFNVLFSVFLYIILYITAPIISSFFGSGYNELVPVLRVLGIRIIISGVNSVQNAYVSRNMIFRKFFWSTLIGTIASAIIGIVLVYSGYGVWSLVFQYLSNTTISTLVLFITLKWKPKRSFSFIRLKSLIQYGWKILAGSLLISVWTELRTIIIGKVYSSSDLAYYDKGKQFPSVFSNNIGVALGSVLFPFMSNEQDDINRIKATTRMSIRFSTYILCPILLGFASVAEPFVQFVLTETWLPCVPLLQIFCIVYLFQPLHVANIQAIKALGRSDIYLKLEVIKKTIELVVLLITMFISVDAIAIGLAIMTTLFTFVNMYPNIKLLNYSMKEQLGDYAGPFGMSIIMCISVIAVGYLPINDIVRFVLQIIVGVIVYILLSLVTKNKEFFSVINIVKNKVITSNK